MGDKESIRRAARRERKRFVAKDAASKIILKRLAELPAFRGAATVMWYSDVRDEVRTREAIEASLAAGREALIPVCDGDDLRVFRLRQLHELDRGAFGILEPKPELRSDDRRYARPEQIDLVVVPGVAFDPKGGRLGYGRGYYDRFFTSLRPATVLVGLAYDCQILDQVPTEGHDVSMHWLVTEKRLIRCPGPHGLHAPGEDC